MSDKPSSYKPGEYYVVSAPTLQGQANMLSAHDLFKRLEADKTQGVLSIVSEPGYAEEKFINGYKTTVSYSNRTIIEVTGEFISGLYRQIDELEKRVFELEHEPGEDEY